MPNYKESYKSEEKMISEFDFSIKITSKEKDNFRYIKRAINEELYRFVNSRDANYNRDSEFENITYQLINIVFDRHFRFLGSAKAYFTNYKEKEGSFVMDFTIMVIHGVMAYGGIRETIDYFAGDLDSLFNIRQQSDLKAKVKFKEKEIFDRQTNIGIQNLKTNYLENRIRQNRYLIGFVFFIVLLFGSFLLTKLDDQDSLSESEIQLLIEKNTKNHLKDAKIEVFINKKHKDSIE